MLSKPSSIRRYHVAALSIPFRALIDPVVVPGFGFAVIDVEGKVLFHSDPQHNLSENFFVESDGNRRLRALAGARHEELVDIRYWGDEHRALVFPMSVGQQWTLVTFYDYDLIRTVNVEWLMVALVLLVLYAGGYVIICLGTLLVRPRYRAPWLWPDPARSKEYVELLPPLILLSVAFALAIALMPASELVAAAWLVPFLAWVLAFHSLNQSSRGGRSTSWPVVIGLATVALLVVLALRIDDRPSQVALAAALGAAPLWMALAGARRASRRQSPLPLPVNVSYGLAAGFFVILTAVLPAAAFFKVGHGMQIESFIKYRTAPRRTGARRGSQERRRSPRDTTGRALRRKRACEQAFRKHTPIGSRERPATGALSAVLLFHRGGKLDELWREQGRRRGRARKRDRAIRPIERSFGRVRRAPAVLFGVVRPFA